MSFIEFGELGPRYTFLISLIIFSGSILPFWFLFTSVLGLGPGGSFLAVLASFLVTLLGFLLLRQGWS